MNKKIKPNKYKHKAKNDKDTRPMIGIVFCLKGIMILVFISVLSLGSIFIHDFITQSAFFNIKRIEISGTQRIQKHDILKLTGLNCEKNILAINLFSIEKCLASHPWVQSASVKRTLAAEILISIVEQKPLAIVKIEHLAEILINTQGSPFKEYNPLKDHIKNLPIIAGLDLTCANDQYRFNGTLFDSIMDFLQSNDCANVKKIKADKNTGVAIEAQDIYNHLPIGEQGIVQIELGFDNFKEKLNKAKNISAYIDKNFPEKTICSMDLFNIEKVFIKTKLNNALPNNLEKGA